MNVKDFVNKAKEIEKTKTIYVYGTYGRPLTNDLINYKQQQYPTFNTTARSNKYRSLLGQGYHTWDCVGLIKGILWGWDGKTNVPYAANNVPDIGANTMNQRFINPSTNFNNIVPGEAVWMNGHIGIYIGDDLVIEATPSWKDGVQITAINPKGNYPVRRWTRHGKLPWVNYSGAAADVKPTAPTPSTPKPSGTSTIHKVVKGDTPWGLAVKYLGDGSRYGEIMSLNNLSKTANIYVGQELLIPTEGSSVVHKVIKGDTPWGLAVKYLGNGNRYKEIMTLNGLKDNANIYVGQELKIPKK
ncbi:MAG: LysM peptidoglycan-binding domain-containing protein [Thiohalomonadaceae bacterium]